MHIESKASLLLGLIFSLQQGTPQEEKKNQEESPYEVQAEELKKEEQRLREATEAKPATPPKEQPKPKKRPRNRRRLLLLVALLAAVGIIYGALSYLNKSTTPVTTINRTTTTTALVINYNLGSCGTISYPGTYYLVKSIIAQISSGSCISINSSNVRLVGGGNKITGIGPFVQIPPFTSGIRLNNVHNVTVQNLSIAKFSYDVMLSNVSGSSISNIVALNATMSGVYLYNSFNNNLSALRIYSSSSQQGGIGIVGGTNNYLSNVISTSNAYYGLDLNSTGNTFTNSTFSFDPIDLFCGVQAYFRASNKFTGSRCSTNLYCNFARCSVSNTPSNITNVVLPKSVQTCGSIRSGGNYRLANSLNLSSYLDTSNPLSRTSPCIVINSPNVKLDCGGNTIYNSWQGVLVNAVYNTTVQNCNFYNNTYGVYIYHALSANASNLRATKGSYALYLSNSTKGSISNVTYYGNRYGIFINSSQGFLFNNVNVYNNTYGVYVNSGQINQFVGGSTISNSRGDLYCALATYNSTSNFFQNTRCGVTDCNWGASCSAKTLPPLASYPVFKCGSVTVSGNYTANSTLFSTGNNCITISAGNVKFDCKNNLIAGSGSGSAFYLRNQSNVTIQNCRINSFTNGINANGASFLTVRNILVQNVSSGVALSNGTYDQVMKVNALVFTANAFSFSRINNSVVINNTASSGVGRALGFNFINDFKNLVKNNTASSNPTYGFVFSGSRNNTVMNNSAFSNGVSDYYCSASNSGLYAENGGVNSGLTKSNCIWLVEVNPQTSAQCYAISVSSQVNLQQDMLYSYGSTCFSVYNTNRTSAAGSIINCAGHTVLATKGGTFANIRNASNSEVENCYLKGFQYAVQSTALSTTVINNTIAGSNYSVLVNNANYPSILNNLIENSSTGIYLQNSNYGLIQNNYIAKGNTSIEVLGGSAVKILNNTVLNATSIGLYMINTQTDTVQNNNLLANRYGILCTQASTSSVSNMDFGNNLCSRNSQCNWMTTSFQCRPS